MKILFLDFDGVLNSEDYPCMTRDQCYGISPYHVNFLNEIVEQTNTNIVISSSWRNFYTISELKQILNEAGFKYENNIIGMTDWQYREFGFDRGTLIKRYLNNFDNVDNYIIVDDIRQFHNDQLSKFVKTDPYRGLTEEIKDIIILKLLEK